MSDIKMTESLLSSALNMSTLETADMVVESLDESSWLKADIENRLRAKLQEYADELQSIKQLHESR